MARQKDYDHLFKVLLIGDSGVGKVKLIWKFANPSASVFVDFVVTTLDVEGERVKLQLWDTAGATRFKSVTTSYYRGATGIILVYDVNDKTSFTSITDWVHDIEDHCTGSDTVCKVLVGLNDSDLDKKQVRTEEGQAAAQQLSLQFFEISSEEDPKIDEMYLALSRAMLKVAKDKKEKDAASVVLTETQPTQNTRSADKSCVCM